MHEVQMTMLREKAQKAVVVAKEYNHSSELFVAQVADVANQLGWTGVINQYRLVDNVTHLPELNRLEASLYFSLAEVAAFLLPIHDR